MSNLTLIFSGKKSSGKSSNSKFAFCEFINSKIGKQRFVSTKVGKEVLVIDKFNNDSSVVVDIPSEVSQRLADTYSVKIYSFADPLKKFISTTFGLDLHLMYGTDDDKNTQTHIDWESIPDDIRNKEEYCRPKRGDGKISPPSGKMTVREVMQIFGTDVCRKLDENCWSRSLFNQIKNDGYDLSIVCDARFPNEITMGTEIGAKAVRLLRNPYDSKHLSETALDNTPYGEYSLVVDNSSISLTECNKTLRPHILGWFKEYNI
jgi:hypothetical protein